MIKDVTPILIGRILSFAEGVNFDREGTLYCVDVRGGGVWRMPQGGTLTEWVRTGGKPNGSRFGFDGDLFVTDYGRCAVLRLSTATGRLSVYADRFQGQLFRGPNDLCFGPGGILYITDPAGSSPDQRIGSVYAISPDGNVTCVANDLAYPNGLMVTPDGTTLVVAETHTGALHRYSLEPERRFQKLEPLITLSPAGHGSNEAGPDGMIYGADGNLYVAHFNSGFVRVVAPDGSLVASLPGGGATPTNVGFWQDSLYVTEGLTGSIYRLDIGVTEAPVFVRPW